MRERRVPVVTYRPVGPRHVLLFNTSSRRDRNAEAFATVIIYSLFVVVFARVLTMGPFFFFLCKRHVCNCVDSGPDVRCSFASSQSSTEVWFMTPLRSVVITSFTDGDGNGCLLRFLLPNDFSLPFPPPSHRPFPLHPWLASRFVITSRVKSTDLEKIDRSNRCVLSQTTAILGVLSTRSQWRSYNALPV